MDYCNAITIIILALIVALVLHLIFRAVNAKEGMESTKGGEMKNSCYRKSNMGIMSDKNDGFNLDNNMADEQPCLGEQKLKKKVRFNIDEAASSREVNSIELEGNNNAQGKRTKCGIIETQHQVDDYIREKLLDDSVFCTPNKKYCDRTDLDQYRSDFFGFRNDINQSSNGVDMVDRVNDLYLSGNTDLSRNNKGVRIQDMFNGMTQSYTPKPEENPIREVGYDSVSAVSNSKIKGSRGESYTKDNWTYDGEKLENGGEFYNGIHAYDSCADKNMAY
jgi:hypothetical protein